MKMDSNNLMEKMNIINIYIKASRHTQRALLKSLAATPSHRAEVSTTSPLDEIQKVDMIWQHKDTE